MAISFNFVPNAIRVPGAYAEIDNSKALRGLLPTFNQRILVLGQRLAGGTVPELVPTLVLTGDQAAASFGRGSLSHRMVAAVALNNDFTEVHCVAIDDLLAGVTATGKIAFTAAPTAAGTLNLYLGGRRVRVGIAAGATTATVASDTVDAINAELDLAVTAVVNGVNDFEVDLTAKHKGETGNDIDIRFNFFRDEKAPAGLVWAITAMAAGSGNPDIADALGAIGAEQYDWIITPWTDAANLAALTVELATRWQPLNENEGHAFAAKVDTVAGLSTFGNGLNSEHLTVAGLADTPTPPEEIAAALGAVAAFHLNQDPARPLQTLPLRGVLAPPEESRFTLQERNILLFDGIATTRALRDGTVIIERAVTTYQTNVFAVADPSYLDITTLATVAFLRRSWRAVIVQKFPRHKLADDGTRFGAGQAIVTPSIVRGETVALARQWEAAGLVENIDQFRAELIVERNAGDPNRVDLLIPPDIVNQARVFAGVFQFIL